VVAQDRREFIFCLKVLFIPLDLADILNFFFWSHPALSPSQTYSIWMPQIILTRLFQYEPVVEIELSLSVVVAQERS
jgi:hypothetical protein